MVNAVLYLAWRAMLGDIGSTVPAVLHPLRWWMLTAHQAQLQHKHHDVLSQILEGPSHFSIFSSSNSSRFFKCVCGNSLLGV
jgi:hypothetical protein